MRLRWGIAGCGWVARDYVAPAIIASANGVLTALHDVSSSTLSDLARRCPGAKPFEKDMDGFLAHVDAVYIATPNHAHRPLVEAAAARGVSVLCEKPMATNFEDADVMVKACERAGVTYATAFDQRFHPAHRELAAIIRRGTLGTITAIRIVYCCWVSGDFQADNWRIDPVRAGGGALIDLAPHGLDLASALLGERLIEVAAVGQSRVHDYAAKQGAVEDGALLIATTASGILVQLHVAYNCPEQLPRRRLEVVGTMGQITATDTMGQTPGGSLTMTHARDGRSESLHVPNAERSPFLNQVEAFTDAILQKRPFAFAPEHDLHIMQLVMQAQNAVRPKQADLHRAA